MKTRNTTLQSLLAFDRSLDQIRQDLAGYPWDSENPVVTLDRKKFAAILRRFLSGEFSASEIEDWANIVEGREDIGIEAVYEEMIEELIFALANPVLAGDISYPKVSNWVDKLEMEN